MARKLTHVDARGEARMVDVSDKPTTARDARAEATVRMRPETLACIAQGKVAKGDVLAVARVAGIQAAKRTDQLIPLCHGIALSACEVHFDSRPRDGTLRIETIARAADRTGVEMEALVAASVAALTVYDMVKALERGVSIEGIRLLEKRGGKSGTWRR